MKKTLRKLFCALLGAAMLCPAPALAAEELPEPPELYAEAAVLMDADTGQVLYGKNEDRQMQPASLTKIMTCLLAMELGDPDDLVTVTPEALRLMRGSSTAGLREGETLTLAQMLYALMLPSANDAANAIAIHLAGSTEEFAQLMNQRAEVSLPSVEEYSLIFTDGEGDLQQAVISGEASVLSALLPDGVSPQKVLVELPGEEDLADGLPDALTAQVMACSEDGEKLPWPVGTLSLQVRVDPVPVEEPAAVQPDPVPEAAQEGGSLGILWAGLGAAALAAGVVFFLLHRARPRPHP